MRVVKRSVSLSKAQKIRKTPNRRDGADGIINIYHACRTFGQSERDENLIWSKEVFFPENLLKRTARTHSLVPDFGLSIIEMRGFYPERFEPNRYGEFTWSNNQSFLKERETPAWRLIRKEPLFTAKRIRWRNDLESQLKLLSQYRYVPSARRVINFLLLAGPHSDWWKKYRYGPIRTGSEGCQIGIYTTNAKYNQDSVINFDVVYPIADVSHIGISSAYNPIAQ